MNSGDVFVSSYGLWEIYNHAFFRFSKDNI